MPTLLRLPVAGRHLFFLLLSGILALFSRPAAATHIVGGELDLQHQSGNIYRITLNLYFDALNGNPGALDQDLTVSIFEKGTNRRLQNLVLPLTSNTAVAYTNPACTQPTLSTRSLLYSRTIELPPATYNNPAGYYAAVERCCRNNGINNIVQPGNAGQTFYLEFPAVVRNNQPFINSTPRIFPPLSDYACRGDLFYYNFSGQDADGDSLVYELATPFNGSSNTQIPKPLVAATAPYSLVTWNPGLSTQNQIPGNPTLSIGRFTGRLEVRPTQIGLFVFGIKCSEYRRGEKIGEVRRDFQLKVLNCPTNTTPEIAAFAPNSPRRAYQPGRDTLRLRPDADNCIRLRFTDIDRNSRLSLSLNAVNYAGPLPTFTTAVQGTVRTPGSPDTLVSQLCFPTCLDSKGRVFFVDVIVADDGCALPKRDTVRVAFTAVPAPNSAPRLTTTAGQPLRARPGDLISFDVTATDPENDPITLTLAGRGFQATAVGAQFTQGVSGTQVQGRFTWRVPCPTTDQQLFEFEFLAATSPCNERQATSLMIPVQVDYTNTPPELTSSLPAVAVNAEPIVIRRVLGEAFEATLQGLDIDTDQLTLTATGTNFDLARAGMSFVPTNGAGRATGIFRWDPNCELANQATPLEVTFQLQEATCRPVGQQRTVRFELVSADTLTFLPPNIFTPNADGANDYFEMRDLPPNFCNADFSTIKVFNRWGKQVYVSTDRTFRWDGSRMPAGVYYYLIEYTNRRRFKGNVTIAY